MNIWNILLSFLSCSGMFLSCYLLGKYTNNRLFLIKCTAVNPIISNIVFDCSTGLAIFLLLLLHLGFSGLIYSALFILLSWVFVFIAIIGLIYILLKWHLIVNKTTDLVKYLGLPSVMLLLLVSGLFLINLLAASFPEVYSDPLWCHLMHPQRWLLTHDIFFLKDSVPHSAIPLSQGLLNLMPISSFGDAMAHYFNCFFLIGVMLCAYEISAYYSNKTSDAFPQCVSVLSIITIPVAYYCSISAMSDIGALFYCMTSWLLILKIAPKQRANSWLLLGLYWGTSCAIKPNYITLVFVLAVMGFLIRGKSKPVKYCLYASLAFLAAYYIYPLRNMIETGNPFWPMFTDVFGNPYGEYNLIYQPALRGDIDTNNSLYNFFRHSFSIFMPSFSFETLPYSYLIIVPLAFALTIYKWFNKSISSQMKYAVLMVFLCMVMAYINFVIFGHKGRKYLFPFMCITLPILIPLLMNNKFSSVLCVIVVTVFTLHYSYFLYGQAKAHSKWAVEHFIKSDNWDSYLAIRKPNYYNLVSYVNSKLNTDSVILVWSHKIIYYLNKEAYRAVPNLSFGMIDYNSFNDWTQLYRYLKDNLRCTHIIIPPADMKIERFNQLYVDTYEKALSLLNQVALNKGIKLESASGSELTLYEL